MQTFTLNSSWEFYHAESKRWYPARVPSCIHTDLQRNGLIPDPFFGDNEKRLQWIEQRDWTYRLVFEPAAGLFEQEEVDLVCEGLDTLATLVLNGETIGRTENMFCGFRFAVRAHLHPGRNTLEVTFASPLPYLQARQAWQTVKERNDPVGGRSRIRKEQRQFGWDWGPPLVTCGVWRALRLEAWSGPRLAEVRIRQHHDGEGAVALVVNPQLAEPGSAGRFRLRCRLGATVVATAEGFGGDLTFSIPLPRLWWPAGQGEQPLYHVEVDLLDAFGAATQTWTRQVGLRNIELVREKDDAGESFVFRVNGCAVFAKGANWIPDHAFANECTRARYVDRLGSAVAAHMNMVPVWGGGIYEADNFYGLCDELGLLVWQDFVFACALYPGAPEYLELVRAEVRHQVRRLRHHACLALWCGNNEIPMMDILARELRADRRNAVNYARLFHEVLPEAVAAEDGVTAYWPSSPWTPPELFAEANASGAGDVHYWEVWAAQAPVKSY
jgi:beta-mannosidase